MKVGDVVKIKKLENYTYGGDFTYLLSNWNNVNHGIICRIDGNAITVIQNNYSYAFIEKELELINWLKII